MRIIKWLPILVIAAVVVMMAASPAWARPDVEEHYPKRGADNVPVEITIRVEFDEDMDEDTLIDGISLRDDDGKNVPGRVSYDPGSRKAAFKPDSPLKYNTRYRVRLSSSIENESGRNLRSYSFYFITARDAAVYVDAVEITDDTLMMNRSPVNITIDAPGSERVLYDGDELDGVRDEYYLDNVVLKPGSNSFSFVVVYQYKDETGKTQEASFEVKKSITFVNMPEAGATVTHDLGSGSKVSLFDKQLTVEFPKGYYLRDGLYASDSQLLAFKLERVHSVSGSPAVSYLFNIAHAPKYGDEYRFDRFEDYVPGVDAPAGAKMTLPLENLGEAAFSTVTVLYDRYDGVYGNWENIGGQADAKSKTITVPFKGLGRYVAVNRIWNFEERDMESIPYVEYLWAKGIMSPSPGMLPDRFGLLDENGRETRVTRGEFAVMLVKALGLLEVTEEYQSAQIFNDLLYIGGASFGYNNAGHMVPLPHNDAPYIETAAKNRLIDGSREKDGRFVFRYYDGLTREQAAISVMTARGLQVNWSVNRLTRNQLARNFKDYAEISTSAGPYVLAALQNGFMKPDEDWNFRPKEHLTRLDAAEMIYKLMESKKLL